MSKKYPIDPLLGDRVIKTSKPQAGVYEIVDPVTDERYVGSTVNLYRRTTMHRHLLRHNKHPNNNVQKAFSAHGPLILKLHPLPATVNSDTKEALRLMEQSLVDRNVKCGRVLNIQREDVTRMSGVSPSVETRDKLSRALVGRVVTEETKQKQSESLKGREISEEWRQKISIAQSPGDC